MPTPLVNLEITDTFTTWKNKINDIVSTVNTIQTDGLSQLATERQIDGIDFNGTQNVIRYASCSTAAGTRAKTVSIPNFNLITGSYIIIRFANTNTASNPTLNVSGTGAKNIRWNGSNIGPSYIRANRLYALVYTGSVYEILGDITQACIQQNGGLAVNDNGQLYVNFDLIPEDQMQQIVLNMVQEGGGLSVDSSGKLYVDFDSMPTDKFETMLRSIRVPIWLTKDKNFYVNGSTGSDTLDAGRGESSSKPFKTIQACINYVTDNYNISNRRAIILVAPGYDKEEGDVIFLKDYNTTSGSIQIKSSSGNISDVKVAGFTLSFNSNYYIYDLTIEILENVDAVSTIYGVYSSAGRIDLYNVNIDFTHLNAKTSFIAIASETNGFIRIYASNSTSIKSGITITGSTDIGVKNLTILSAWAGGNIQISADINVIGDMDVYSFANVYQLGVLRFTTSVFIDPGRDPVLTVNGTITGVRYRSRLNGIIDVNGGGEEFFPGSEGGITSSGGQYN